MKLKLIIGLFALIGFNQAWAVPCSNTATGVFELGGAGDSTKSVSISCVDSTDNNDPFPGDLTAFGDTYTALQKYDWDTDALSTEMNIHLEVTPDTAATQGTWSFLNIAAYDTYVLVLKDGGADDAPLEKDETKWSAYLLDWTKFGGTGSTWSGDWIYGGDPLKAISHLSVYGFDDPDRDEDNDVPAPAILGIMGIGLLGMIFSSGLRRRKIS